MLNRWNFLKPGFYEGINLPMFRSLHPVAYTLLVDGLSSGF